VVPVGLTRFRFEGKRPQTIRTAIQVHETPEWIDTNWERQPLWAEDLGHCSRQLVSADVPMRCYLPHEAAQVIDLIEGYQAQFRETMGMNLVHPSDEFYLLCGRELPPADRYDGMPQYSNGVGMTRDFLDGWAKARRRLPARMPQPTELTIVCGTLIAPILQQMVDRLNAVEQLDVRLLPVVNRFFGETVTVSGLLMGQDVVPALRESGAKRALLPRVMFDHTATRTIDEYSLERIGIEAGAAVAMAGEPDEVVRYIRALARAER
jgi:NifB/MoaA-like Fe-S oxidoreductase